MAGPSKITIEFEDTLEGATGAEDSIRRIRLSHEKGSATAVPASQPAAVSQSSPALVLYDSLDPSSRSPELLKALDDSERTFSELSGKLRPNPDGSPLRKSQVRAIYRNVRRKEKRLMDKGLIKRRVVRPDFTAYDADNAGRYSVSAEDKKALAKR